VKIFCPPIITFASHSSHHCPFTCEEPGYGDVVYEADYLLLFIAADLRMDPALSSCPVSLVAFADLGNTYTSTTRLNDGIYLQSIGFPLRHQLHYTNPNVFFGSTYMAEHLTTHRDYYLHVEQIVFVLLFFLSFFCLNVNSGALIARRSTAHLVARRISFVKGFIIGYLFVVHVFVVYISRRDEER
jgi:hypothetical protein